MRTLRLGGIEIAYAAYRRYATQTGEPAVLNCLTGDQRFFLGYAQMWRDKMREDRLRECVLTNPHSPFERQCIERSFGWG